MDAEGSDHRSRGDRRAALVGTVIGDRYRLGEPVAVGSSALVFSADDGSRPVTVKLLRVDPGAVEGFAERFERVMQQTSALAHPTLQAVFAWGYAEVEGRSMPYVVSESLTGGSLRDLYDRGRRLSPSQVLALGLDVCRGLDHAHRRGLVHGEISPSKLVFGADRRVRIIDLGLSQLMFERVWSEPSLLPTHMARYASPEQAGAAEVGPPSDIYSLCLCMIEGVTGEVPFVGDSTQSTLRGRIGRLMPVSADLGPLAAVLEHAGRPEPAERYSAAQFGRALMQQAGKLPRPEPLPLVGTGLFEEAPTPQPPPPPPVVPAAAPEPVAPEIGPGGADDLLPDPTLSAAPLDPMLAAAPLDPALSTPGLGISAPDDGIDHAPPADSYIPADDDTLALTTPSYIDDEVAPLPAMLGSATGPGSRSASAGRSDASSPTGGRSARRWAIRILVPLAIVLALGGLGLLAVRLFTTPSYDVPDLTGLTTVDALAEIDDLGWSVELTTERSDLEPRPDHVIRTVPAAGLRLARGEPFLIVASEGPEFRQLPVLTGLPRDEAVALLGSLSLEASVEEAFDEETPAGDVIRWTVPSDPELGAGADVLPGVEVVLVVSEGPAPRTVPDLFAAAEATAVEQLEALGLQVEFLEPAFSDEAPVGTIAAQAPEPGSEVARDSVVQLTVSKGPDLVVFPDLTGTDFATAQALLAEQDLEAVLEFGASDGTFVSAAVDGSTVAAGDQVRRFSQVALVLL